MDRKCLITIVRHGETALNVQRLLQGHTNTALSETGIKQAELLGKWMRNEKFTKAYSSDLSRAHTTATLILKYSMNEDLEIKQDLRIRERCYGKAEGSPVSCIIEEAKRLNLNLSEYTPEDGESVPEVMLRAQSVFEEIISQATNQKEEENEENILIVSHGGWIQYLMRFLHKSEDTYCLEEFNPGKAIRIHRNTAVSKMSISKLEPSKLSNDKRKFKIVFSKIDDIQHLGTNENHI